jgi:hypothetical protein
MSLAFSFGLARILMTAHGFYYGVLSFLDEFNTSESTGEQGAISSSLNNSAKAAL